MTTALDSSAALALYRDLSHAFAAAVPTLAEGTTAERFHAAMQMQFERLAPHRAALGALFGGAMGRRAAVDPLGEQAADIHAAVREAFGQIVAGSSDAPKPPADAQMTSVLYGLHLALLLFWLFDRSEDERASADMLAFLRDTIALLRPMLIMPLAARTLARLAGILEKLF